mmetsp:Transcript_19325/g.27535  ORF Transcript_19325/g.27535 Transcript_19325/m.27535 type:complete len:248 (+) Transcript_19325:4058-4801(+)
MPTRATSESAGLDLYSAQSINIPPKSRQLIATDLAIKPPPGTYAQIMPRSGLSLKYQIDTKAGVIDRDYRGNVMILLENSADEPFQVTQGDRIAQLILYEIATPAVTPVTNLDNTARGSSGFGSSGVSTIIRQGETSAAPPPTLDAVNTTQPSTATDIASAIFDAESIKPYDIHLSSDPFEKRLPINIVIKGDHPTLGMQFRSCTVRNRLQLANMALSTPGSRLPKWKSTSSLSMTTLFSPKMRLLK